MDKVKKQDSSKWPYDVNLAAQGASWRPTNAVSVGHNFTGGTGFVLRKGAFTVKE
jgi:hypothetical protein